MDDTTMMILIVVLMYVMMTKSCGSTERFAYNLDVVVLHHPVKLVIVMHVN